jgi:hypothetical protein
MKTFYYRELTKNEVQKGVQYIGAGSKITHHKVGGKPTYKKYE